MIRLRLGNLTKFKQNLNVNTHPAMADNAGDFILLLALYESSAHECLYALSLLYRHMHASVCVFVWLCLSAWTPLSQRSLVFAADRLSFHRQSL